MQRRTLLADPAIYDYVLVKGMREHPEQLALREATASHPHAVMQIAPEQGQLMAMLVKLLGARRAIEIGVFTGYSALSVALALPDDGRLVACDISDENVKIAIPHWQRAGVADKIDVRIAPAAQTLRACLAGGEAGHVDFVFIDADKTGYDTYYEGCLRVVRPGGLILIDNVLQGGRVVDPSADDENVQAIRALNEKIASDERVDMTLLPVADGLTMARIR
jgi:predicted O-methyltransferase YrrM